MRHFRSITTVIGSHRLYLGFLLGVGSYLVFSVLFRGVDAFTPEISILLAMWVSGVWQPKRAALLGLLLGLPIGFLVAVQPLVLGTTPEEGLLSRIIGAALAPLFTLMTAGTCALIGLLYGSIADLYRRRAIF